MSRSTSILNALREVPTGSELKAEHQISLVDHTQTETNVSQGIAATDHQPGDAEQDDSDQLPPTEPPTPAAEFPLYKKVTSGFFQQSARQTVRQQVARRKYRRYGTQSFEGDAEESAAPLEGEEASPAQTSYLERGRAMAKNLMKRRRTMGRATEEDSIIDILYENQRGAFLFGIPRFSSSSLLNFDPKPWQNVQFRTSPVDIRNAQVPDPSWEWAWKSWYVDMSRDVDEEGWEYSFSFQKNFAWHGNHPWFHSFVRRRRWLRKRVRKHAGHRTKEQAHELTAEYFTIHPKTLRSASADGSRSSKARSSDWARMQSHIEDGGDVEKAEITDIGTLMKYLRKAAVDREKLVDVRRFVDTAGEELYYLSDRMPDIMGLFVFQSSRRQLLTELMHRFDGASERRESLADHDHDDVTKQAEHDRASRHADNLLKAVRAADDQVKKLEYWSDIKSMAQGGETLRATDDDHWDASKWQGLDPSSAGASQGAFASKQHHSEAPPELHKHAEHTEEKKDENLPPDRRNSVRFESPETVRSSEDSSDSVSRYTTAPESASEISGKSKGKGKAKVSDLDGVQEEEFQEHHHQTDDPKTAADMLSDDEKDGVEVVEPQAITADYGQNPGESGLMF